MATLYIMCGIPGSGKSTWIKNHITSSEMLVSRDTIRFNMVKENEPYFSKEDEVWKEFIYRINHYLEMGYNVFADATHINTGARRKLLKEIKGNPTLAAIHITTPISLCLKRNVLREGRECVPESAIKRMYSQFEEPSFEEGFEIIYTVDAFGGIEIRRK